VGVIFMNFEEVQKNERKRLVLDSLQAYWIDMMRMISLAKPDLETPPKNKLRRAFYHVITQDWFDVTIMICIVLNMF
jgi:hypothetical protein